MATLPLESPIINGGSGSINSQNTTGIPTRYFTPGNSDSQHNGTKGVPVPLWDKLTARISLVL